MTVSELDTGSAPVRVSCTRIWDVGVGHVGEIELSAALDEPEEFVRELFSLASAPTRPRPEGERVRGHGIDPLTLGATPPGDVPSVG
jgi:hypothetical protein